jgi:hypothetical protein
MTELDDLLSKYLSTFMSWDGVVNLLTSLKAGHPNCGLTANMVKTCFPYPKHPSQLCGPPLQKGWSHFLIPIYSAPEKSSLFFAPPCLLVTEVLWSFSHILFTIPTGPDWDPCNCVYYHMHSPTHF